MSGKKFMINDAPGLIAAMSELREEVTAPGTSTQGVCDRLDIMIWALSVIMAQNAELLRAENER